MVSFDGFVIDDKSPIYMQIIRYIKRGIAAGVIKNQEEIPSRRMLASLLGVNPNTVQKAYHMLEEENLIESRSGAKSCIAADEERVAEIRKSIIEEDAVAAVNSMQALGITKAEAVALIDKYWRE